MNEWDWLRKMRAAGEVKRFHTCRMVRTQTVAAHTWNIMMLLMAVGEDEDAKLLTAAMVHDVPEVETGDVPAPAKGRSLLLAQALNRMEEGFYHTWGIDSPNGLLPRRQELLAWADTFELCLWCIEEVNMGNAYALEPLANGCKAIKAMEFKHVRNQRIFMLNEQLLEGRNVGE